MKYKLSDLIDLAQIQRMTNITMPELTGFDLSRKIPRPQEGHAYYPVYGFQPPGQRRLC